MLIVSPYPATPISCATVIIFGDDYSSPVSEASATLQVSGTHIHTTLTDVTAGGVVSAGSGSSVATNTGTADSSSSAVSTAASTTDNGDTANSGSSSEQSSPSSSSGADLGVVPARPLGGALLAGVALV
jgi:hypothetical protein